MNSREITTLMHKLFYGDIPQDDGWVHLMERGKLDRDRIMSFLDRYFKDEELLLFVNAQHCAFTKKAGVYEKIVELLPHGIVKIADPRFHSRVIINQVGVGVGSAL